MQLFGGSARPEKSSRSRPQPLRQGIPRAVRIVVQTTASSARFPGIGLAEMKRLSLPAQPALSLAGLSFHFRLHPFRWCYTESAPAAQRRTDCIARAKMVEGSRNADRDRMRFPWF